MNSEFILMPTRKNGVKVDPTHLLNNTLIIHDFLKISYSIYFRLLKWDEGYAVNILLSLNVPTPTPKNRQIKWVKSTKRKIEIKFYYRLIFRLEKTTFNSLALLVL